MESITTSKRRGAQSTAPPLEQDVAHLSTRIEGQSCDLRKALEVALVVISALCEGILSPDVLTLAKYKVLSMKPKGISEDDYHKLVTKLFARADAIRRKDPISGMF